MVFYVQVTFTGLKIWHVLVAVFCALILLILIILICVKLGFFKRKQRPDQEARRDATKEELQNLSEPIAMD